MLRMCAWYGYVTWRIMHARGGVGEEDDDEEEENVHNDDANNNHLIVYIGI